MRSKVNWRKQRKRVLGSDAKASPRRTTSQSVMTSAAVLSAMLESLFAPRDLLRRSSCCSGEYTCVRTAVKVFVAGILAYHLFVDVDSDLFRDTVSAHTLELIAGRKVKLRERAAQPKLRRKAFPIELPVVVDPYSCIQTTSRIPNHNFPAVKVHMSVARLAFHRIQIFLTASFFFLKNPTLLQSDLRFDRFLVNMFRSGLFGSISRYTSKIHVISVFFFLFFGRGIV